VTDDVDRGKLSGSGRTPTNRYAIFAALGLGLTIACQHAAWTVKGCHDEATTTVGGGIYLQIALIGEDGRALDVAAQRVSSKIRVQVEVMNVGRKGMFLRTDAGTGPFVDIEWVAADGQVVEWIPPSDDANAPLGRYWARYKYLAGSDETGVSGGAVRDDQTARLVREVRVPDEATDARSILLTVWLDLEWATMGAGGLTHRRETRQFSLPGKR